MWADARHLNLVQRAWPRGPAGCTIINPSLAVAIDAIGWSHWPPVAYPSGRLVKNETQAVVGDGLTAGDVWAVLMADGRIRPFDFVCSLPLRRGEP